MAAHPDRAGGGASGSASLVDVLRQRADVHGERGAYTFLVDGEAAEARLTYRQLDVRARAIGAYLQQLGAIGERVMLLCPPGLEYVAGFWGCLYAGAVAVPAYPPRANRTTDSLQAIVRDAGARVVLTTAQTRAVVEREIAEAADLPPVTILTAEELTDDAAPAWRHPGAGRDTLAFLQYTSGSTGTPKGVMVSHGNLIANMTAGWDAVSMTPESVPCSWLPPFHDMGLISGVIQPIFAGLHGILMSPSAFIQRPSRWLRAISRYGVTHTGGPPFAYDYCLRKIVPDQLDGVDLSSWFTAYVGAEPIRVETLERFAATYAPYGLRASTLYPCYGMAETTLMVSGGPRLDRPLACLVNAAALEEGRVVTSGSGVTRALAACGRPLGDTTVVIAHPDTLRRSGPDEVGEIWVSSPAVAQGYWNRPAESEQAFRAYLADTAEGPFLRTGDLGFLADGQVVVAGRLKDVIILKGKNHYPQDIESTAERSHAALRPSGGAAFSVDLEDGEHVVVVHEVEAAHVRDLDADAVVGAVRQAVADVHDAALAAVVLLRPGAIPKTSSGKIRRRACREAYLSGSLQALARWSGRAPTPPARSGPTPQLLVGPTPQPPPPCDGEGEADRELPSPWRGRGVGEGASSAAPSTGEIRRWLVAHLANVLQVEARTIDVREPFSRYGMTSVEAVGLSGDLEAWLGRRLSPTLAYDYPSIDALARRLGPEADDRQQDEHVRATPVDEPIAVVGVACRLPGADGPDALWRLLRDGVDATGEVPADRWSLDTVFDPDPDAPGKTYTRRGGFLESVDGFDADFFRIAAREAVKMDPQQRLLLEVSWEALEDAGQPVDRLAGSKTGVFMGICSADYARLHLTAGDLSEIDAYSGTGVAFSVAIGRISYVLGLQGPNLAVDTSCSSSLVAVHLACQSLRQGECRLALAGGVNLMLTPETTIFLSKARALAPDGRCKTFDAAADGYARGEGCGVVALKRLSDALADGDRVLAVIRGSAVNHDGHTNGLTAPNGPSQEAVIRAALTQAGLEPGEVGYVEAHGTGTALGDPIEVQALAAALGPGRPAGRQVALGSIKTNVGHLEAAAGVAGLLEAILAVQRGLIPPHLHLREPSPHVPWSELPFVVPTAPMPWPYGYPRRVAGVSAFGFSGTNAHLILEEAPRVEPAPRDGLPAEAAPFLLPISARDPVALRALAERYRDFLGPTGTAAALHDVTYTAAVRRSHHPHRLAVVGHSREELVAGLDAFLRGEHSPGVFAGQDALAPQPPLPDAGEGGQIAVSPLPRTGRGVGGEGVPPGGEGALPGGEGVSPGGEGALPGGEGAPPGDAGVLHLAAAYAQGHTPDWQALHPHGGRCVSLPRYPWQRERFWVARRQPGGQPTTRGHSSGHPLLGPRVEPATQPGTHVWECDLDADTAPYLRDHRVDGAVVVPGATLLDLALSAARQALGPADLGLEAAAIEQVLAVPDRWRQRLQVVLSTDLAGTATVRVFSRPAGQDAGRQNGRVREGAAWTLHAEARIAPRVEAQGVPLRDSPAAIQARCPASLDGPVHYAILTSRGLDYGPAFRRVARVWQGSGEALGQLQPPPVPDEASSIPTLLDACFQVLGPALGGTSAITAAGLFLPVGLERLLLADAPELHRPLWCHAVARPSASASVLTGDLFLLDEDGRVVGEVLGLRVRHLASAPESPSTEGGSLTRPRGDPLSPTPSPLRGRGGAVEPAPLSRSAGEGPGEGASLGQGASPAALASYLTELVARATGRPAARIDRQRPLTDLGLDSLMAMELRNRIDADLGIVVPLTTFLQAPSIDDLASELAEREIGETADTSAALPAVSSDSRVLTPEPRETTGVDLPLSHGQRALWLTHQLAPRSTAYHIMFAARLHGPVDPLAMASAVRMLVERHASLRTTYAAGADGQPVQRVHAWVDGCFADVDASGWPEADLHTRLGAEADRPFDLERGPLFRVTLFRRVESEHVLLLTVHHLAADFWSLEVLVDELRALYDAAQSGRPPNLSPARQHLDFVRWQADMLAGEAGERHWRYWQRQLAGELPVLAFPTDRPHPRVQTYRGALCDFTLDEHLTARIKELARTEGSTLYATLLAGFAALLGRYTGQHDLLIGSPMAGRGRADFERTVGYLMNVVPLRADLAGRPSFRKLVRQARDTVLAALDHQDYPFPLLVQRLQPPRDPGRSPLVQLLFIWYRSALLEASAGTDRAADDAGLMATPERGGQPGLAPVVLAWEQRGAPYDVMLLMTEANGALLGRFQYNADLFDPDTIARLAEHFRRLLESVVAEPDRPVDTARMLTAAERVQQLVVWNATDAAYPTDACLHELFEAQAQRTPDAVALVHGEERLTYRALNQRANRVTRMLRTLGVGPDVLVGICTERTPAMVVGLLAILKAGGAYVPLDPAYPEARISYMLRDSRAAVLLTRRSLAGTLGDHGAAVVYLDDLDLMDGAVSAADDDVPVRSGVTPANLAYVIYTSGSTGQPKGVAVEHRGPVALAAWARDAFSPADLAGVLASTSICFDLSVFELFAPLSWGGTVILAENVLQLPQIPAAEQVTLLNTVPSGAAELLRISPLPASVRVVTLCGEVLMSTLAQALYRQPGVREVYNLYGPTEDTVYSTWALVERGSVEPPPIGRPLPNWRVYLLDERLQLVPIGVPGEVYTAGVGVARGYLHQPELTAERFIPSPFGEPGERLYRVGDLARYRPDGTLEILGRVDGQVKIRGYRVELGEVEAVLSRHPAVQEAVVTARDDHHGGKQLVAYLVGNGAAGPTVSELRRFLQRDLPDYMVPATMVWLDELPHTPNGKLDRRALPDPGSARPDLDSTYVAPRTPAEALLAAIWAEVLEVERVGIYDSFFDLGGASFASVTIATRANEAGLPLTADLLFAYPTIAALSELAAQLDALGPQTPLDTQDAPIDGQPQASLLGVDG